MVIPINEVSLASVAENILPEVTYTIDNIYGRTPDHSMLPFDVSFFLLIDQIEETKYIVIK